MGQVRAGRVTRVAEFGAFVELEPGIEGLAHVSTFAPTGRAGGWSQSVAGGMTGSFEILSIDPEKKRIGVALVQDGAARGPPPRGQAPRSCPARASRARSSATRRSACSCSWRPAAPASCR